jgi:hypothetical protein
MLNERINVLYKENQSLKEEAIYLNHRLAEQQRENKLLKTKIEDSNRRLIRALKHDASK